MSDDALLASHPQSDEEMNAKMAAWEQVRTRSYTQLIEGAAWRFNYSYMKAWAREHCGITQFEQAEPYTMVKAIHDETAIEGIGFAKCGPHDTWNAVRGLEIARGRAFAAIARVLMAERSTGK